MLASEIARHRLMNHRLAWGKFEHPQQVVAWFGAMQAQDFTSAKWAIGLRCESATEATIDWAIANREILRTWLLRGTLHSVAAADVHWMLALSGSRLIASNARRYRELELDQATFSRSFDVLIRELQGSRVMARSELLLAFNEAGISTAGQRGYHILARAALEGLICFGPRQGRQETFVLLDEWVGDRPAFEREQAVAELARRYFQSHGPATLQDYAGWSGLSMSEARAGLAELGSELDQGILEGETYWFYPGEPVVQSEQPLACLLPAFDEFYLAYKRRDAILDARYDSRVVSSNGIFRPILLIDGQIVGIWQRELKKGTALIRLNTFNPLTESHKKALLDAAHLYGTFLGFPVRVESSQ